VPCKVSIGESQELKTEFPANFIAETTTTDLAVMCDGVASPGANQKYMRGGRDEQGQAERGLPTTPRPRGRTVMGARRRWPKEGKEYRGQTSGQPLSGRPAPADGHGKEDGQLWDIEKPSSQSSKGGMC